MAFRRTRRLGRRLAAASSPGSSQASSIPSGSLEDDDFQDPPRHWGRIGALVGVWALVLGGGAWFAPAFASGGVNEETDPRDEAPSDPINAAGRYLRLGSGGDIDRAYDIICTDSETEPETNPEDLLAISEQISTAELSGRTPDIDVDTDPPVTTSSGVEITATVFYISLPDQASANFTVTVREVDGEPCVADAVREQQPDREDESEVVEPEQLASDYLSYIVGTGESDAAVAMQCRSSYTGIEPSELEQAIVEWGEAYGGASGHVADVEPAENSTELFDVEIELDGELNQKKFTFQVGVQEGCIVSLEGGEALDGGEDLMPAG